MRDDQPGMIGNQEDWGNEPEPAPDTCSVCGLAAHRFGRNEGTQRWDPMGCVNTLRMRVQELNDQLEQQQETNKNLERALAHETDRAGAMWAKWYNTEAELAHQCDLRREESEEKAELKRRLDRINHLSDPDWAGGG